MDCAAGRRTVEEVFYLRPVGEYSDRQGAKYAYTADMRQMDSWRGVSMQPATTLRSSGKAWQKNTPGG
jgi:hypothetical protein